LIHLAQNQNVNETLYVKNFDICFIKKKNASCQHRVYIMRVSEQFASLSLASKGSNGG